MSLCQHFTPAWMAEALVERHFRDLGRTDLVYEPTCGLGAFLQALPQHVPAWGFEVDPAIAVRAMTLTGRPVTIGDFLTISLDGADRPTAVIGNPPFRGRFVDRLLERCHELLPDGGRAGFILPAYAFRTASRVVEALERWSISQEMLPRSAFAYRMREPLVFAIFTKDRRRALVGFALYEHEADRQDLAPEYRTLLARTPGSAWRAVCGLALKRLRATELAPATLTEIYSELERNRPSRTQWWREKIRQTLRVYPADFVAVEEGRYALA